MCILKSSVFNASSETSLPMDHSITRSGITWTLDVHAVLPLTTYCRVGNELEYAFQYGAALIRVVPAGD